MPPHSCPLHVYASVLWLTVVWGLLGLPSRGLTQSSPGTAAPLQLAPVEVRSQRLGAEQIVRETSTFATTIDTSEATAKVQSVADVLSESVGGTNFIAALQDEIRLWQDRLSLRPLLRYQLVHSDFGAAPTFGVVRLKTARDAQEDSVSPSLDVKYKLASWLDLKGNIGRFTRVPKQGYTTPANAQVSVGNGTNPQDIAFVSATKAYVSRLGRTAASLLILNPTTLATLGKRELRSLLKPNDLDGTPEPSFMLVNNGLLYVTLQHLDELATLFPPVAPGEIVVIDPVTDSIVKVIQLPCTNPFSQLRFSPTLKRILVSCVGFFGVQDGGIVAIDPTTNAVDPNMSITEAALGGDITDFEVVSSTKAFAIVLDANFSSSLVTFNPSTGQPLATVLGPLDVSLSQMAINSRNELYVAVTDTATTTPGVRVFDTVTDRDLIPGPLNVGQLPPVWVLFLE